MSIMSICCDGPRHSHCVWHSLRSKKLATALETTTTFTTFQRFGPVFVPIGFQRMWRFPNRKDLQQPREGDSKEKPGSLILGRLTRWIGRWCLGKQKTTRLEKHFVHQQQFKSMRIYIEVLNRSFDWKILILVFFQYPTQTSCIKDEGGIKVQPLVTATVLGRDGVFLQKPSIHGQFRDNSLHPVIF